MLIQHGIESSINKNQIKYFQFSSQEVWNLKKTRENNFVIYKRVMFVCQDLER